jgi:hypothetical protein
MPRLDKAVVTSQAERNTISVARRKRSLKVPAPKILRKLRRGGAQRRPAATTGQGLGIPDVTGQTVFHDRPLRFRSLTVAEPDLPALEHPSTILGAFKIRVAKRNRFRQDAGSLVQRKYAGRGYALPVIDPRSRVSTFLAYDEGRVVGTVGLGADLGKGLSADELYREEINRLRARGHRVCEFTRLAVDRNAASKSVLAGLFHTAYIYASKICGYTHAVIEVNPRHVAFYRRELRFEPIGPERLNTRVNAPAVLLCVAFETIADGLAQHAGKSPLPEQKRTLYHYGFSKEEELGVLNRLYALVAPGSQARRTGRRAAGGGAKAA